MKMKYKFFYTVLRPLVNLFLKIKFGYRCEKAKDLPDNYIVLSNHTTDFDVLFVAMSFKKQMFFVGSEHISRWKNAYKFLRFAFKPILRPKGTVAASTVKEILKTVRQGSNVCIFAEGVRSWDGVSSPIAESTGKLIKSAKCALVTYRITGGYFVSPMWSEKGTRKGEVFGAPVNVYTKEQLAVMSVDEINEIIKNDLHEDAYARQLKEPKRYTGKNLAEHMENLLFICPFCGERDTIRSSGDTVFCTECKKHFRYDEYGMLRGAPYFTVRELYKWQKEQVAKNARNGVSYEEPNAILKTVRNHAETVVSQGTLTLSPDGIDVGDFHIPFDSITELAMHGRHSLVFTAGADYYEVDAEGNVLKFMLLYKSRKEVLNGLFIS